MTEIEKLKAENNKLTKMIYEANTRSKGRWDIDEVNPTYARCSVCKEGWSTALTNSFDYCPTCGARMVRGELQ